jgi:hypothetical protein
MTGAAHLSLPWAAPGLLRLRQLGVTAAMWLLAANLWTGAPLFALWVGSQTQSSGSPSMSSVFVAVAVLAAVNYGLVALLWRLGLAQDRLTGAAPAKRAALLWPSGARVQRRPRHAAASMSSDEPAREPLVLINGGGEAPRRWWSVTPHLEFGFDVIVAALPRDGSIAGTQRAMDRAGWQTAHIVARPRDAEVAVDLARAGRARSLLILEADSVADDPVGVATEIAEFAAFRGAE